ncbi:MAG: cytochrome P450, partial [Pseudomonadales bacterium]|nr:cytochrome P450 [Pseudomonadales bacterium]
MSEALVIPDFQNAYDIPIEDIDVSDPMMFKANAFWPYFERMRKEDPVHYCAHSPFGPFWSITKFNDIMEIEKNHEVFSSETGGITIFERMADFKTSSFIQMDPPKHDVQRKSVTGVVAPSNLSLMEPIIRERAGKILDELPIGEEFNWVDRVSIELTTQMLATLFDFPFEDRRKLTYWSDMATSSAVNGGTTPEDERRAALLECLEVFTGLWNERVNQAPGNDLISMLAHNPETQNMDPMEYLG